MLKIPFPNKMMQPSAKCIFSFSFALSFLVSGCATECIRQVEPSQLAIGEKGIRSVDFIGFADDRAFAIIEYVPMFPWSAPSKVIQWCPVSELTPQQVERLKLRMQNPNGNQFNQHRGFKDF
jgi:hypothetical protein